MRDIAAGAAVLVEAAHEQGRVCAHAMDRRRVRSPDACSIIRGTFRAGDRSEITRPFRGGIDGHRTVYGA
ncbi:hypothetical protein ACIPSA_27905 [Streptomyces sp. NPDC086549]|uniref:hypothetical protein n=1 Tax=Streptomyces sp. NPDC086549 TaxID=3365752 RepID=UPI003803B75B